MCFSVLPLHPPISIVLSFALCCVALSCPHHTSLWTRMSVKIALEKRWKKNVENKNKRGGKSKREKCIRQRKKFFVCFVCIISGSSSKREAKVIARRCTSRQQCGRESTSKMKISQFIRRISLIASRVRRRCRVWERVVDYFGKKKWKTFHLQFWSADERKSLNKKNCQTKADYCGAVTQLEKRFLHFEYKSDDSFHSFPLRSSLFDFVAGGHVHSSGIKDARWEACEIRWDFFLLRQQNKSGMRMSTLQ